MRLYLVRHGKAEDGSDDANRKLNQSGRSDIRAMAEHLAQRDVRIERFCHSSLSRARQTAVIFRNTLAPGCNLEECDGIQPWGDVRAFIRRASGWDEDAIVCGHEPFLGAAASMLMTGDPHAGLVHVKTGTVMAFERTPDAMGWYMRWMLTPQMVRVEKQQTSRRITSRAS